MTKRIEFIARGFAMRGSQVLLCRNDRGKFYYLPGGHVEFGESATGALRREFLEECRVSAVIGNLAMACEVVFEQDGSWRHEINLVFHVQLPVAGVASFETGISFHWLDLAAIPTADVRPDAVKAWLMSGGGQGIGWISQVSTEEARPVNR